MRFALIKKIIAEQRRIWISCKQIIYLMNHVQFPPPYYHYHYSCLYLFDLCRNNFATTKSSSFNTSFCTYVCSLAKKVSSFSDFECLTPHSVYFLYYLACFHRNKKFAYVTKIFFLLFLHSNMKPHFIYCLYCVVCLHTKQKVAHTEVATRGIL